MVLLVRFSNAQNETRKKGSHRQFFFGFWVEYIFDQYFKESMNILIIYKLVKKRKRTHTHTYTHIAIQAK